MIMLAFIFCLWLPNDNAGFYFLFKGSNIHDTFLQVRAGSGNRDYHYTHWTILIDRATEEDLSDLSEIPKHVPIEGPDTSVFFLNDEEHQQLRYLFVLMILCLNEQLVCVVLVFLNIMLVLRMPWSGATRTKCQLCNKGILMESI